MSRRWFEHDFSSAFAMMRYSDGIGTRAKASTEGAVAII